MPTVISGVIAGTKKGIYKIVIKKHSEGVPNQKVLFYQECEDFEDLAIWLKGIAKKFVVETFVLIYGENNTLEEFKDGFDFDRDGAFIIKSFKKLIGKYNDKKNQLEKALETLTNTFQEVEDPKIILNELFKIFKELFPIGELPMELKPKNDREFLEISIEMFCLLYAKAHDLEYNIEIYPNEIEKHPFIKKLLKYKLAKYGKESFNELGLEGAKEEEEDPIKVKQSTKKFLN